MKTIKFILISLIILGFTNISKADIQVTVYGKGGIVIYPDGTTILCPLVTPDVCQKITIIQDPENGTDLTGFVGRFDYNGEVRYILIKGNEYDIGQNGEIKYYGIYGKLVNE